tara:strand:+ start:3543 stop:4394 length:852 start_codon:yes stop_codon:yes gene_type:complete
MKTNIILFHKGTLPWYIKSCIEQLHITQTKCDIYFLTDANITASDFHVVNINDYSCPWVDELSLWKNHEDPLWRTSFERFFYINAFILDKQLNNVVHFDSDVMLYKNINDIKKLLHNNVKEIAITPHKDNELVCGFMYIKNKNSLETLCDELLHIAKVGEEVLEEKFKQMPHEMRLLGYIDKKLKDQNYITRLPVSPFEPANNLYDVFEGVFDPSTYGQYFGNNNTVHKDDVNRLADRYIGSKVFPTFGNDKKPFLRLENGNEVPIFNLHVHNKQLHEYFSLR